MKKKFLFLKLITLLLLTVSTHAQSTKAYAKFSQEPDKRIHYTDLQKTNFFIEYKSKKTATIYIELVKNGKVYASTSKIIKSKEPRIIKLNIHKSPTKYINPSDGYNIKLSMYEGEKNNYKELISETIIDDIQLSRLMYSKL